MSMHIEQIEREDIVAYLNAGLAATAQAEFYQSKWHQESSIEFLHRYIAVNYRELYADTLALPLNDFNRALTLKTLLLSGAPRDPRRARHEGKLIAHAIRQLPAHRAYNLLEECARLGRSNRRLRATVKRFVLEQKNLPLHVLKYRKQLRRIVRHFHVKLDEESQSVLFALSKRKKAYETELYEKFRQAHYSREAIFELPYTVAEGLIARHRIKRKDFLEKIAQKMTRREQERMQRTFERHDLQLDRASANMELTRQLSMILGMKRDEIVASLPEFEANLDAAARRAAREWPTHASRIQVILDVSFSTKSSRERSMRPLAVALSTLYVARAIAGEEGEVEVFWTDPLLGARSEPAHPLLVRPRGPTDLARPLLDALKQKEADLLLICSDGFENSPAGGFEAVWDVWKERIEPTLIRDGKRRKALSAVHINPVFDAEGFVPRRLAKSVPTVCVHHGSDIAFALVVARFDAGELDFEALTHLISSYALQVSNVDMSLS